MTETKVMYEQLHRSNIEVMSRLLKGERFQWQSWVT